MFVNDDGNLQIAVGAVATGGSDLARKSLSSFINDYTLSLIRATSGGASDEAVAFAARVQNVNGEDLIDYGDINSDTYGIGITLFHEWNHVFNREADSRSWKEVRSTGSVIGPQVDFANGIRTELDPLIRMG